MGLGALAQYRRSNSKIIVKRILLIGSILLNIFLLAIVVYIGGIRTDYFKRVHAKIAHAPYVPERKDADCVASWNNCIDKLDMQTEVVFFGDSETAGGDFQKAFPNIKSINLGYIGEDTKGMLRRVEAIVAVHPKKIFIMAGINGLQQQTLTDFEYWYAVLVDSIRETVPEADIYVESILPVAVYSDYCDNAKIIQANAIIQRLARERDLTYIDLHSRYAAKNVLPDSMSYDGLHLTPSAYRIWYNAISEYMLND